jgi:hypothetical protein
LVAISDEERVEDRGGVVILGMFRGADNAPVASDDDLDDVEGAFRLGLWTTPLLLLLLLLLMLLLMM